MPLWGMSKQSLTRRWADFSTYCSRGTCSWTLVGRIRQEDGIYYIFSHTNFKIFIQLYYLVDKESNG